MTTLNTGVFYKNFSDLHTNTSSHTNTFSSSHTSTNRYACTVNLSNNYAYTVFTSTKQTREHTFNIDGIKINIMRKNTSYTNTKSS